MNIDEKIEKLLDDFVDEVINGESGQMASSGWTRQLHPEVIAEVKQLLTEVVEYVLEPDHRLTQPESIYKLQTAKRKGLGL